MPLPPESASEPRIVSMCRSGKAAEWYQPPSLTSLSQVEEVGSWSKLYASSAIASVPPSPIKKLGIIYFTPFPCLCSACFSHRWPLAFQTDERTQQYPSAAGAGLRP